MRICASRIKKNVPWHIRASRAVACERFWQALSGIRGWALTPFVFSLAIREMWLAFPAMEMVSATSCFTYLLHISYQKLIAGFFYFFIIKG